VHVDHKLSHATTGRRGSAGLFHGLLKLAAELYKAGVILEARICLTCKYLSKRGGYYCSLLKAPISVEELRVDCPDHSPAARPAQWK
jgi:hypothetical protein